MRLLVTRPEPEARRTAARLEALGHTVLIAPLSRIVFRSPPDIDFLPAALVFTSGNGVRAVVTWAMVSPWRDVPVFAVGERTGTVATEAGFANVIVGGGDAASLVDAVVAGLDPDHGRLLHVTGRHRSIDLSAALSPAGFDVVMVEGYEAVAATAFSAATAEALASGAIDGVLVYSTRAATIFGHLMTEAGLAEALGSVVFYAISEAAGEPLRNIGEGRVIVAAEPTEKSLIASIER